MFEKIVVGVEGSERSEDAVALARLLSTFGHGRVIAACVYGHAPGGHGAAMATHREAEQTAQALTARCGDTLEVRTVAGLSAARALHELAEHEQADLIVVGSTHRGKIGQTLPGSTGYRLLHGSPCPVAAAPLGYRDHAPQGISRVGAAYCEDKQALHALDAAYVIAERAGAQLYVIGAYNLPSSAHAGYGAYGSGDEEVYPRESAKVDLEEVAAGLRDGVDVRPSFGDGEPADVLVKQAADLDLLVMGSRGYGPLRSVMLGSVSHEVLLRCPSPVLIVPRGAPIPAGEPVEHEQSPVA